MKKTLFKNLLKGIIIFLIFLATFLFYNYFIKDPANLIPNRKSISGKIFFSNKPFSLQDLESGVKLNRGGNILVWTEKIDKEIPIEEAFESVLDNAYYIYNYNRGKFWFSPKGIYSRYSNFWWYKNRLLNKIRPGNKYFILMKNSDILQYIVRKENNPFSLFGPGFKVKEIKELNTRGVREFIPLLDGYKKIIKNTLKFYNLNKIKIYPTIVLRNEKWSNDAVKYLRKAGLDSGGHAFFQVSGFPNNIEAYKKDLRDITLLLEKNGVDTIQIGNEVGWEYLGDINLTGAIYITQVYGYLISKGYSPHQSLKGALDIYISENRETIWKNYKELLKISYKVINEVNPEIKIAIGAGVLRGMKYDDKDSILNYFDIIDIHHYGNRTLLEERIENHFDPIIKNYSIKKEIWLYEVAGPWKTESFNDSDLLRQSQELVKLYVYSMSKNFSNIFWASLTPSGGYENLGFPNLALLDEKGRKKPAYYTYMLLTEKLRGYIAVSKLRDNIYKFDFFNKNPVLVVWNEGGKETIDVSGFIKSEYVKISHIVKEIGVSKPFVEIVKSDSIVINESPIFIEQE